MARISRRMLLALLTSIGVPAVHGVRPAHASAVRASTYPTASGRAVAAQSSGRSMRQIMVDGLPRSYIRYEPAGLDVSIPVPLVLVLHARGGNGAGAERAYGMSQLAEQNGFVVVYPDALGAARAWNAGQVAGQSNDVSFVRAVVEQEAVARPLDEARIFVCGHSSGAAMTYRLAGEASELFSAVGVVAGPVGFRMPDGTVVTIPHPARPVSVIHFHGTEDEQIPYQGGREPGGVDLLSVADSIAFWVAQDGCDPTPTTETVGVARRETYTGGQDGAEVTLWTIQGGGHGWPTLTGTPSDAVSPAGISATELIWAFFAAHPRGAGGQ
jgi:polyhydroxybutyrate depolymerase